MPLFIALRVDSINISITFRYSLGERKKAITFAVVLVGRAINGKQYRKKEAMNPAKNR